MSDYREQLAKKAATYLHCHTRNTRPNLETNHMHLSPGVTFSIVSSNIDRPVSTLEEASEETR